jgi:hypothetical protein
MPWTTTLTTLTNYQVGSFSHALGVEPAGAFVVTINWGDGTTSPPCTITQIGTGYVVKGTHQYTTGGRHTISLTVTESQSPVSKVDVDPATLPPGDRDVVQISQVGGGPGNPGPVGGGQPTTSGPGVTGNGPSAPLFDSPLAGLLSGIEQFVISVIQAAPIGPAMQAVDIGVIDQVFSLLQTVEQDVVALLEREGVLAAGG